MASGVVIGLVALGIAFHVDDRFTTALPGYTQALQKHIEDTSTAQRQLAKLRSIQALVAKKSAGNAQGRSRLRRRPCAHTRRPVVQHGAADAERAARQGRPDRLLDVLLHQLPAHAAPPRGVVRRLPHEGLVIIGVHTPEFAFEHVASNVGAAVKRLGVKYPVVQDNDYGTWNAFHNSLLAGRVPDRPQRPHPARSLRRVVVRRDRSPDPAAPRRQGSGGAERPRHDSDGARDARVLPRLRPAPALRRAHRCSKTASPNTCSRRRWRRTTSPTRSWRVESERIVAGAGARLRLHFRGAAHLPRARRARASQRAGERQAGRHGERRQLPPVHAAQHVPDGRRHARAALHAGRAGPRPLRLSPKRPRRTRSPLASRVQARRGHPARARAGSASARRQACRRREDRSRR